MKKYINLNMVLILGLMDCEAPVHAGGGKGVKIELEVVAPVLVAGVVAGGTYLAHRYLDRNRPIHPKDREIWRDEIWIEDTDGDRWIKLSELSDGQRSGSSDSLLSDANELGGDPEAELGYTNARDKIGNRENFFDNNYGSERVRQGLEKFKEKIKEKIKENREIEKAEIEKADAQAKQYAEADAQAKQYEEEFNKNREIEKAEIEEAKRIKKRQVDNEYKSGETYYDADNPTAHYQVEVYDDGSYTKTFTTEKRMEIYDKNGFLRFSADGKVTKLYDENGRLESALRNYKKRNPVRREYNRGEDGKLTGYKDKVRIEQRIHGEENEIEIQIGRGVIDRDGKVTHTSKFGLSHKTSIGLTEEDKNGTQRRDPNYGQRKTTVVASQEQTDQQINGAAAKNESASGNSQNQNEVVAGNNPDRGSNNQPDGDQSKSGGDEGGDNSRQGGGDLLLE